MRLHIESAEYLLDGIYPLLKLSIDGRPAYLMAEQKPTLARAGILFLGGEFEDVVPAIDFQPDDGEPIILRGFTRDPVVFALWCQFTDATSDGSFEPGSVEVPGYVPAPHGPASEPSRPSIHQAKCRGPTPPHARGYENPDLRPGDDELLDEIWDRRSLDGTTEV
jgi:hypothetical protein